MSKILITGMSASHASESANARSTSFASVIKTVLTLQGHDVVQLDPEVSWNTKDLDEYDSVLVGLSPLTSLSANRVYGALSVIDVLLDTDKLVLFLDAPEPNRITSSLRAIVKTPDNLTKPFYSYRKGYDTASQPNMLQNLLDIVEHLLTKEWPTTLYPSLPWQDISKVAAQLPEGAAGSLIPISLDSYLINNQDVIELERREKWVVENYSSMWVKSTTATLQRPTVPMKWHKGWTDMQVENQIAAGVGALFNPHLNGTWWSYRLIQCINTLTPVATDWRESSAIGSSWAHLASKIEDMSQEERNALAKEQRKDYVNAIPTRTDAAITLSSALKLYSKKG
jgi:hypothetical protein